MGGDEHDPDPEGEVVDADVIDADVIDAEVVDGPPKRCPQCESYDVGRAKHFAAYVAVMVAATGAAIAVDQLAVAFFAVVVLLAVYYAMPPFRCHACGARFD